HGRRVAHRPAGDDGGWKFLFVGRSVCERATGAASRRHRRAEHLVDALPGVGKAIGGTQIRLIVGGPFTWRPGPASVLRAIAAAVRRGPVRYGHVRDRKRPVIRESGAGMVPRPDPIQLSSRDYGV